MNQESTAMSAATAIMDVYKDLVAVRAKFGSRYVSAVFTMADNSELVVALRDKKKRDDCEDDEKVDVNELFRG